MKRPAIGVFLILWLSYAFFWHSRDWNTSSRLMLTYAIVDNTAIKIDGYEEQTGDKSFYKGHYYSDKLPGYSLLATVPYAVAKLVMGLPSHPIGVKALARWPADYIITVLTSGLFSALTGALLVGLSQRLRCGPKRAVLVGLAYGLATPAYTYATLAYGHQASAACLLGAFALLWIGDGKRLGVQAGLAGFLAAFASVIEIQVGPVSAILGIYSIVQVVRGDRPIKSVLAFSLGAAIPTAILLIYNTLAFDSPWKMGYFYHAVERFAAVHSAENPLGVGWPDASKIDDLLIQPARGLFLYAPILLLAVPGFVVLAMKRQWAVWLVSLSVSVAVFLVNLSYPEWSGGWSTGPRLLTPMLPFAMLAVAGLLGAFRRRVTGLATSLTIVGAVVILLFQGVGGRIPDPHPLPGGVINPLANPLLDSVLPIWAGERLPGWTFGERFATNAVSIMAPRWLATLGPGQQWQQFAPLVIFQIVAIALLFVCTRANVNPVMPEAKPRVDAQSPAKPDQA